MTIAFCGLALILAITISYASGAISFENYTILLLGFTGVWFGGILLANWVKRRFQESNQDINKNGSNLNIG